MSESLLGGRYQLRQEIKQSDQAQIFRGVDRRMNREVAVKFYKGRDLTRGFQWREAAILRRLDFPGVIPLLDEGISERGAYLITPWVEGSPFPGKAGGDFRRLRGVIEQLCDILARVHAVGVIHGDLKPANILVDDADNVTILDFGMSALAAERISSPEAPVIMGSRAFMSPEQLRGGPPARACDCYALGLILYEVLCGRRPHPIDSLAELMRARLQGVAPPLQSQFGELPSEMAEAVSELLSSEPDRRRYALQRLLQSRESSAREALKSFTRKWLVTDAVIDRLGAGKSVDIGLRGQPGGESLAATVGREIEARGIRAMELEDGESPLESLSAIVEDFHGQSKASFEEVRLHCRRELENLIRRKVVLVADEQFLDSWTEKLLAEIRPRGGVVRLRRDVGRSVDIESRALQPSDLETFFDGPKSLFQSARVAAQLLWRSTGGQLDVILVELSRWERWGVGVWKGTKFVVDPTALMRLRSENHRILPPLPPTKRNLSDSHRTLLCWVQLADSIATTENLRRWLDKPFWQIEAQLRDLQDQGLVAEQDEAIWQPRFDVLESGDTSRSLPGTIHRRIADSMTVSEPHRFEHILHCGSASEILEEGCSRARQLDECGHSHAAITVLTQALAAIGQPEMGQREGWHQGLSALVEWAKIALSVAEPEKLEHWLEGSSQRRFDFDDAEWKRLIRLVELARLTCRTDHPQLLDELTALGQFSDWELELRRQMYRVRVASQTSMDEMARVFSEVEEWVKQQAHPEIEGAYFGWNGILTFFRGDFQEAARLHSYARRLKKRATARLASTIAEATSRLEALEYEEALELTDEAMPGAHQMGHLHYQARLYHLSRAARYRLKESLSVDEDWLEAVEHLGMPNIIGLAYVTEAAIAWRNGEAALGARLAGRSVRCWQRAHNEGAALLARALKWNCDGGHDRGEGQEILEELRALSVHRLVVQAAALVADAADVLSPWIAEVLEEYLAQRPVPPDRRLEVLSLDEVRERLL